MATWRQAYGLVLLILFTNIHSVTCTQEDEQNSNAVQLTIYRVSVNEWQSQNNMDKVTSKIAAAANTYCKANSKACGLASCCTNDFKGVNVGTTLGSPVAAKNEKDLLLSIYINLPSGEALDADYTLDFVVKKDVVEDIIGQARDGIFTETGYYVTFVGDDFYGIAPADLENKVIIPIAFAVLVAVIVTAVALYYWDKRRQDRIKRDKMFEKRKKTKVVPVLYNEQEEQSATALDEQRRNKKKLTTDVPRVTRSADTTVVTNIKSAADSQNGTHQRPMTGSKLVAEQDTHFKPLEIDPTEMPTEIYAIPNRPKIPDSSEDSSKEVRKTKKKKKKEKRSKRNRDDAREMYPEAIQASDTLNTTTTEL
ncbi:hypothetical protein ScPMuIL_009115 [Solemya velum]